MWSFYFLGKLYLFIKGYIRFNFIFNLLLAIFVFLPLPKDIRYRRTLKALKLFSGLVFAVLLLWYDSWLPPILYSIRTIIQNGIPTKEFVVQFLMSSINPWVIGVLLLILLACYFLNKRVTLTPAVIALILIVPLSGLGAKKANKEDIDAYMDTFYKSESVRAVKFEQSKGNGPKFDIILVHICSLAWDDLKFIGLDNHPFLKQFDLLFANFNGATGYSDPSAIRLLLANCGQRSYSGLYQNPPKGCYLLESLREQGYETYSAIDNISTVNKFVDHVINYGMADPPIETKGIPIKQYNYDNSPLYDDLGLLRKWLEIRQRAGSDKAALYINITSLHGGAHAAGEKQWWDRNEVDRYKRYVLLLFEDLEKFFNDLSATGRNYVILFVPEHGVAMRGSSIQPQGLRDIPLPQITNVPVGIKLIGDGHPPVPEKQELISKPTSYLALAYMLSSYLKAPPFGAGKSFPQDVIDNIPETSFVAENEIIKVAKKGPDYFMFDKDKKWVKLPSSALQ